MQRDTSAEYHLESMTSMTKKNCYRDPSGFQHTLLRPQSGRSPISEFYILQTFVPPLHHTTSIGISSQKTPKGPLSRLRTMKLQCSFISILTLVTTGSAIPSPTTNIMTPNSKYASIRFSFAEIACGRGGGK